METESARLTRIPDRWRLTATAVMTVFAVAALLSGCATGAQQPATRPASVPAASVPATSVQATSVQATSVQATSARPPYYVTIVLIANLHDVAAPRAVVRDSATGKVTGTVPLPGVSSSGQVVLVTAAANDRSFIIATDKGSQADLGAHLFRFGISADGRPGPLTELAETPADGITGMALSPDGTKLAISLDQNAMPQDMEAVPCGVLQVIDLNTRSSQSWSACHRDGFFYYAGSPSWVNGNRMIAFSWWKVLSAASSSGVLTGTRLLDAASPGASLLTSPLTPVATVNGAITSAMISSDGHTVVTSACREVAAATGHGGTVTVQITELSAQGGRLRAVRVLRAQSARYRDQGREFALNASCGVLAVDPSGHHALVWAFQLGRTDNGVFTALPGFPANTVLAAAAW